MSFGIAQYLTARIYRLESDKSIIYVHFSVYSANLVGKQNKILSNNVVVGASDFDPNYTNKS